MLSNPTLSLVIEYEDLIAYFALKRSEHRDIERSLVGQVKVHFPQSILDAWAVLDPADVKVGNTVFDVGDESMSLANVRAFIDGALAAAGDDQNSFQTIDAPQFTPVRACTWIDLLHRDGFTCTMERNKSGVPFKLTGTASTGRTATAFIRVRFEFEEPAKTGE